jgi:periplasmic protein TonB
MIRGKQPEANLRLTYVRTIWISFGLSVLLHGILFVAFPGYKPKAYAKAEPVMIIQLEDIPETKQERRPPPPARPVVPIATDNPDVPDDVTIEDTDLDMSLLDDIAPPPPLVETQVVEMELEEEEEEIVELWKVEKQPEVIKRVLPEYPDIASKANITGKVFVTALITKEGKVERIGKITGPEVFHEAVREAAMQWEFEPAIQNDRPVKVWVSLPFTFTLN